MKILGGIFYSSFFLLVYHVVIFPVYTFVRGMMVQRRPEVDPDYEPTVSMLISAYNEENVIKQKLENSLKLEYPKDKLRIIVVANGCVDSTVDIVKSFEDKGIELFEYGKIGKDESQNRAMKEINSEIIVFSDANVDYNADAISALVKPFVDNGVGVVTGKHVYVDTDEPAGAMEGSYWNIVENRLKQAESDMGYCIGAAGAIYAVRRETFVPPKGGGTSDLLAPLLIAANGYRTVYTPDAQAYEESTKDVQKEYERKIRVVHQSAYGILKMYPWLLNPFKSGKIAFVLWSHKVLRWFTPFLMLALLASAILRLPWTKRGALERKIAFGSTFIGFMAILGAGLGNDKPIPVISHVYYFILVLKAAFHGVIRVFSEGSVVLWGHDR